MKSPPSTVGGIQVLDVLDALGRIGVDRNRVCARAGVDLDALARPEVRVPTATVTTLFIEAERMTGDPFVGLHAGEHADPRGPLIYLVMSSRRLEDGLRAVARFSRVAIDTLQITFQTEGDRASTVLEPGDPTFEASHHAVEYLLMAFFRGVRRVFGDTHRLREVHFRHADPGGGPAELVRAFGCPVRFGQPANRLVYPLADLRAESQFANPRIAEELEKFARLATPAATLRDRVASVTRQMLARGVRADARSVAHEMGMSERSLQRGLQEQHESFRSVRDSVVREVIDALLSNPHLKLEAVALSVGFADGAALAKAVKRWTGCAPAQYRKRLIDQARRAAVETTPRA